MRFNKSVHLNQCSRTVNLIVPAFHHLNRTVKMLRKPKREPIREPRLLQPGTRRLGKDAGGWARRAYSLCSSTPAPFSSSTLFSPCFCRQREMEKGMVRGGLKPRVAPCRRTAATHVFFAKAAFLRKVGLNPSREGETSAFFLSSPSGGRKRAWTGKTGRREQTQLRVSFFGERGGGGRGR